MEKKKSLELKEQGKSLFDAALSRLAYIDMDFRGHVEKNDCRIAKLRK